MIFSEINALEIDKIVHVAARTYACVKNTTGSTKEYHQKDFDKWSAILKEAIQMAEIKLVGNMAKPVYSKKLLATLINKYFTKEVADYIADPIFKLNPRTQEFLKALNS